MFMQQHPTLQSCTFPCIRLEFVNKKSIVELDLTTSFDFVSFDQNIHRLKPEPSSPTLTWCLTHIKAIIPIGHWYKCFGLTTSNMYSHHRIQLADEIDSIVLISVVVVCTVIVVHEMPSSCVPRNNQIKSWPIYYHYRYGKDDNLILFCVQL